MALLECNKKLNKLLAPAAERVSKTFNDNKWGYGQDKIMTDLANRRMQSHGEGLSLEEHTERLKERSQIGGRTNLGSDQEIPVMDDFAEEVNESAAKTKTKTKDGLGAHIKQDGLHAKEFGNDLKNVFNGTSAKNAADAGEQADALGDLKKAGGKFLDGMGRGNKTLGAAKVGAYMVGASMLVDMLNPFDND